MPSLCIVRQVRGIIQDELMPVVSAAHRELFVFGMQAFGLRSFHSAASNARMVVANVNTAASKTLRLLGNKKLADRLGRVFDTLDLVTRDSVINVDHSDVHGLTALVGAVQTRCGRAIPCFVETTYAQSLSTDPDQPKWARMKQAMRAEREHLSYTQHTLDALQVFADRIGFWPRLVFDRGFGNETLITYLTQQDAVFYIRLKAGRYVECDGKKTQVQHLDTSDTVIELFGLPLRVVRSCPGTRHTEPWCIITNDHTEPSRDL